MKGLSPWIPNGIFGCIPHARGAYQGIDLREIGKYKKKGVRR